MSAPALRNNCTKLHHLDRVLIYGVSSAETVKTLKFQIDRSGCKCLIANSIAEFETFLHQQPISLALISSRGNYRQALSACHSKGAGSTVLLTDGVLLNASAVVEAVKLGAEDILEPPYDPRRLCQLLERVRAANVAEDHPMAAAASPSDMSSSATTPRSPLPESSRAMNLRRLERLLVGRSDALQKVRELIVDVADTSAPIMITGESGTGKELVARAVHQLSSRAEEAFVPVNMAAVPAQLAESLLFGHEKGAFTNAISSQPGWCATADRGTLFLDEIGEMDISLQPKLLRFLQEGMIHSVGAKRGKSVDVRIITATNRAPAAIVRDKILREDLYFRLHVVPIHLPSLRERPEDIAPLADLFLKRAALRHRRPVERFSQEAIAELERARWPGNIRQLENLIERMVIFAKHKEIHPSDFPMDFHNNSFTPASFFELESNLAGPHIGPKRMPRLTLMEEKERAAILEALNQAEGHVVTASQLLGVGQATLYRKIKKYSIPKWKRQTLLPGR